MAKPKEHRNRVDLWMDLHHVSVAQMARDTGLSEPTIRAARRGPVRTTRAALAIELRTGGAVTVHDLTRGL